MGVTKNKNKGNAKERRKWLLKIFLWSITISSSISLLTDSLLNRVNTLVAFILLIFIISLGIFFDIIGIAVTVADERPFHAMASKKIHGAKIAINMVKNADKVSTFCNDVVGDICGIVSGTMGAVIVAKVILIFRNFDFSVSENIMSSIISVIIGALIAASTICGKSLGKTYAINNSNAIVSKVSKLLYLIAKDR
ncbi:hypothetical protein [Clostridium guangxiense]|uniref:hypothetical protein n=1 Tax=Clostridium guangxiense TaxID=1662055 RepID=UPI001E59484C|nr:hypothetical protein [Clostridium guangxiense]MCD2345156.1 hypothetical protein [Clostridium guangxiense]